MILAPPLIGRGIPLFAGTPYMKLFGYELTRSKAAVPASSIPRRGWYKIMESFAGAWQQNVEVRFDSVLANPTVFACQTLIASDIAKLAIRLVEETSPNVWKPITSPAYSPVLRKPNRFQNRIQFMENWILSKLQFGNTYILKQRDLRGVVIGMYILDPTRVTPLVTQRGDVYYQLNTDELLELTSDIIVPASEIIHDRYNCLFHPLVGLSPIFANGMTAMQGQMIINNSAMFFQNGAKPSGILIAPGEIDDDSAARLKSYWEENFSGKNAGKIAVVGDGLTYESLTAKATDSQLIEQLKWTSDTICSTYHVPPYKVGIGEMPAYNNIQALNVEYYAQCLQILIESVELCLDEGLAIPAGKGTELDIDNLLRMDAVTQMEVLDKGKSIMTPNEQRNKLGLETTTGGDVVYRQQQDFSLAALAKRDAQEDPFAKEKTPAPVEPPANDNADELEAAKALVAIMKGLK